MVALKQSGREKNENITANSEASIFYTDMNHGLVRLGGMALFTLKICPNDRQVKLSRVNGECFGKGNFSD